jgi:hypothetical protein
MTPISNMAGGTEQISKRDKTDQNLPAARNVKMWLKLRFHSRANPSCSSNEQLVPCKKSAFTSLAGELHVTIKNGKRRAALWICKTMETQLKQLILPKSV